MKIQYRYIDNGDGWPDIQGEVKVWCSICYNPSSTNTKKVKAQLKQKLESEIYKEIAEKLEALKVLIMRDFTPICLDSAPMLEKEINSLFDSLRLEE